MPDDARTQIVPSLSADNASQPAPTAPPPAAAQQPDPDATQGVCTLKVGQLDERDNTVKYIYSCDRDYVVYYSRLEQLYADAGAEGRPRPGGPMRRLKQIGRFASRPVVDPAYESEGVQAQLTADPAKRATLRRLLLPLGTERAKLQALLKDWPQRHSYDLSIATALQLALDGRDNAEAQKSALQILQDARASILNKREIAGKAQYVVFALLLALVGIFLLVYAQHNIFKESYQFWQGAQAGLIGAVMSIAIGIRNRTVALNMAFAGNLSDSALRLVIGAVSGGTLVLLSMTGLLPTLKTSQGLQEIASNINFVLLLGILAGFVEQLVPSLLDTEQKKLSNGTTAGG